MAVWHSVFVENPAHEILAPALNDLKTSGLKPPDVVAEGLPSSQDQTVMLVAHDGSGSEFRLTLSEDRLLLIARAAESVQEWALEQCRDTGISTWPPCPVHPGSHPLFVRVEAGRVAWSCRESGILISEVGSLNR